MSAHDEGWGYLCDMPYAKLHLFTPEEGGEEVEPCIVHLVSPARRAQAEQAKSVFPHLRHVDAAFCGTVVPSHNTGIIRPWHDEGSWKEPGEQVWDNTIHMCDRCVEMYRREREKSDRELRNEALAIVEEELGGMTP